MQRIDPKKLDLALVPAGTPMFADIIERIAHCPEMSATRKRDLVSGLTRVAKALNRAPAEVPADPKWLQPRLEKVMPAAIKLSEKSWQNARSDARAALAWAGIVQRRHRAIEDLAPAWRALWQRVLASKDQSLSLALCRFTHFLNGLGVSPDDVMQTHADSYLHALEADEISKAPRTAWRAAINAWNRATTRIEGWPQTRLAKPRRQKVYKRADEDLPADFVADLAALMQRMAAPDPFAEDGPSRPLRPASITAYTRQLKRFASELLDAGVPAEEISGVAALCDPERAELGMRAMYARNGNEKNRLMAETAALLRNLARRLDLGEATRARLAKLAKNMAMPAQKGMTRKNRERLRPLQDDKTYLKLLMLPEKLFARETGKTKPFPAALVREDALAIALLLYCPLRIKNIAGIHLDRHLQHMGDGRVFLVMTEDDTKTGEHSEAELPGELVRMLKRHLATRTPLLCASGNPWLFPRRDGQGPVDPNHLSSRLKKRIRREVGIEMNAHLFRHLAAMIWLDARPGAYEAARRLLGHSASSHTINLYSGLEARSATNAFGQLLETRRKGPRK